MALEAGKHRDSSSNKVPVQRRQQEEGARLSGGTPGLMENGSYKVQGIITSAADRYSFKISSCPNTRARYV